MTALPKKARVTVLSNVRCSVDFKYKGWSIPDAAKERKRIVELLDDAFSIEQKGSHFNPRVQQGQWDGKRHVFYADNCTFPKGLTKRLKALLREAGYAIIKDDDRRTLLPPADLERVMADMLPDITLRDYQLDAVLSALKHQAGLLWIATNGGKTEVSAAIIRALKERKALFVVHTKTLLGQTRERLAKRLGTIEEHIGIIGDGQFAPKQVTVAMLQSLSSARGEEKKKLVAKYLKTVELFFADECFPAGTLIGGKPIEEIRVGDRVQSYDEATHELVNKRVVRLFKRKPAVMARVTTSSGRTIVCTRCHPFMTLGRGWVVAADLQSTDMVLCTMDAQIKDRYSSVHVVQLEGDVEREARTTASTQRTSLLFAGAQEGVPAPRQLGDDGPHEPQVRLGAYEEAQPHAFSEGKSQGESIASCDGLETDRTWRQRNASVSAPATAGERLGLADGVRGVDQAAAEGVPVSLQDRHRGTDAQGSCGGGREQSFLSEGPGSQEGNVFAWSWVERVEVLEPTGDGTFGGVCRDGHVYNLEVEDTHTYVAGGFVVHNCHHSKSRTFLRLFNRIPAQFRFGLSGTPYGSDENGLLVEGCFGPVIARVTNDQLIEAGVSARPTISMIEVNEPEIDAALDWHGVYKAGVVANPHRNAAVAAAAEQFARAKQPCLVLVKELWHGDNLCDLLTASKVKHAFVHGQMPVSEVTTQKHRFEAGRIDVLVASSIFEEGADVPAIRALIIADGGQSVRKILQQIGRGLRKKTGGDNTVAVVDFADMTHKWLARHSQERLQIYTDEGFEVTTWKSTL